jgi:hypothetical protein
VRERHAIVRARHGDDLGVDRVVLATMVTDADPPDARRVQHDRLVASRLEHVVHMPPFATRLERDASLAPLRAEQLLQLRQSADRAPTDDLPLAHLAKRDVASAQIQAYAAHD